MYTKAAMGNSESIDVSIEDKEYYLRPKIDSEKPPRPVKTQIDIFLACQQKSMTTAWVSNIRWYVGRPRHRQNRRPIEGFFQRNLDDNTRDHVHVDNMRRGGCRHCPGKRHRFRRQEHHIRRGREPALPVYVRDSW